MVDEPSCAGLPRAAHRLIPLDLVEECLDCGEQFESEDVPVDDEYIAEVTAEYISRMQRTRADKT